MNTGSVHFLQVPFTGLGLFGGYRGDTWLKNRIAVFKRFVLPAILNQTNRNFILLLNFRPEEESNPIVQEFVAGLDKLAGLATVVTYHGIMFWDDKYPDEIASQRLMTTLERTLPMLKDIVGGNDVLLTLQPSDDIYLGHAVSRIQELNVNMCFSRGYMMNYATLEMAEYDPETFPPFSTIKFTADQFLNPTKHYEHTGPYKSHEYIPNQATDTDRSFIVGTHGENISTTWQHPYMGRRLTKDEVEAVLITAGLFGVEPLLLKKDLSRRMKKRLLNVLPAAIQRQIIRRQSPGVTHAINSYHYFNV